MQKNNLKVSIILPTYNGYKYLKTSIDSCLNQTYPNIELIIVDDGSFTKTKKLLRSFKDRRIKIVTLKINQGLSHALNCGFSKVSGDFLTWTSDDNYYTKNAIEEMVRYLVKIKGHFVYCNYYQFKNNNTLQRITVKPDSRRDFRFGNYIGACFLYTRKVYEKTGKFAENLPLVEDYDYWIRVSQNFKLDYLDKPLYYFRRHEKSLTARYSKKYDLCIATTLVKIKNRIINKTLAVDNLLNSITLLKFYQQKTLVSRIFCLLPRNNYLNRQIRNTAKSIYKKRYFNKIVLTLDKYQNNKLSFGQSIFRVKKIIN